MLFICSTSFKSWYVTYPETLQIIQALLLNPQDRNLRPLEAIKSKFQLFLTIQWHTFYICSEWHINLIVILELFYYFVQARGCLQKQRNIIMPEDCLEWQMALPLEILKCSGYSLGLLVYLFCSLLNHSFYFVWDTNSQVLLDNVSENFFH